MCLVFPVKFVNLVVYMTTPASRPPRVTTWSLRQFLGNVANESQTRTWTDEGRAQLRRAADASLAALGPCPTNDPVSPDRLVNVVAPLKRMLEDHMLFALPAGMPHDQIAAQKFVSTLHYAAAASGTNALVLIPDSFEGRGDRTIIDPMPQVELLADYVDKWPGVLFWSRSGAAAFATIDDAMELYKRLEANFAVGATTIDAILSGYRPPKRSRKLLHLSDLHFGTQTAVKHLQTLRQRVVLEKAALSRAVITGDLINTPRHAEDPDFEDFKGFRRWLATQIGNEVLVVPGNHDERWLGNRIWGLGDNKNVVADLSWSKVVVDPTLMCVFLCFDSAREGFAATGNISQAQLDDVAREFETVCAQTPEARTYVRIALLHHHPARYDIRFDILVQELTEGGPLDQERLLALEEADRFIAWCKVFDVRVVLHGHKHLQRLRPGNAPEPAIVGCGTSLGAEEKPLSYNILTIDPPTGRIAVAMHSGNARGFETLATSIPYL
jgi:UDP-2,3-diacylglucosamine pyrophosphatase LpxH